MGYATKLPKNPKVGDEETIVVNNKRIGKRLVTFKCMKKSGFGKWRVTKNKPYK